MNDPFRVLVALGSNQGNSKDIILQGLAAMDRFTYESVNRSSIWKTKPVECPPGSPDFLNAAASFDVSGEIHPSDILHQLLTIENQLGRRRSGVVNEPRVIDLDLICYGSFELNHPSLTLPHPRAHLREFVLAPLNEIEPDFLFPGLNKTTQELLDGLPDSGNCLKCPDF
jgi:2-amino-4-hydroxy-6-hydroxymethyldihydropteridine diphosphokinase